MKKGLHQKRYNSEKVTIEDILKKKMSFLEPFDQVHPNIVHGILV